VAHTGKLMSRLTRHQAGTHPADFTTAPAHFEFGAPLQGHHQLVMAMGMFMGLFIQADNTSLQHDIRLASRNTGCTLLFSTRKRRNHPSKQGCTYSNQNTEITRPDASRRPTAKPC